MHERLVLTLSISVFPPGVSTNLSPYPLYLSGGLGKGTDVQEEKTPVVQNPHPLSNFLQNPKSRLQSLLLRKLVRFIFLLIISSPPFSSTDISYLGFSFSDQEACRRRRRRGNIPSKDGGTGKQQTRY